MADNSETDLVPQKILISPSMLKELKKMAIDLELDKNGKITPDMYGVVITKLIEAKKADSE